MIGPLHVASWVLLSACVVAVVGTLVDWRKF